VIPRLVVIFAASIHRATLQFIRRICAVGQSIELEDIRARLGNVARTGANPDWSAVNVCLETLLRGPRPKDTLSPTMRLL